MNVEEKDVFDELLLQCKDEEEETKSVVSLDFTEYENTTE